MDAPGRHSGRIAVPIMAACGRRQMTEIASIGLDIAKSWFQVHGADAQGRPVLRRKLRRDQVAKFFAELAPTVVGIEACSTAHHWARTLQAAGHRVRLIPPQYVKPFVKRSKTDSADAEAICEALRRSGIRDVAVKTREQQATLAVHRARDLLVRQRTMLTRARQSARLERRGGSGLYGGTRGRRSA